jgi:hypothetical protein
MSFFLGFIAGAFIAFLVATYVLIRLFIPR